MSNTCERCGGEYEEYIVLIRDNLVDIVEHLSCEYDNLCKPCRMVVCDGGAYLTEDEKEELEPKETI
jgi:hypothetical protein